MEGIKMSTFKVGDDVICVDPVDDLIKNGLYRIAEYNPLTDLVHLEGHTWGFMGFRFKLAKHLDTIVTTTPSAYFIKADSDENKKHYIEADGLPEGNVMSALKGNQVQDNLTAIEVECAKAMFDWPEFNTAHEGYAVILEELDELWDEVKKKPKNRDSAKMKVECIQIAAMALRFATEICDTKKANN